MSKTSRTPYKKITKKRRASDAERERKKRKFSSRVKYANFWIIPECPKTQCRIGGRKIYYRSRRTLYLKSEWLCKITTAT